MKSIVGRVVPVWAGTLGDPLLEILKPVPWLTTYSSLNIPDLICDLLQIELFFLLLHDLLLQLVVFILIELLH